jgi:hypothetical protein
LAAQPPHDVHSVSRNDVSTASTTTGVSQEREDAGGVTTLAAGTKVEVRTTFDRSWARGFEILEAALDEHWTRLNEAAGDTQSPQLVLTNAAGEQLLQVDDMLLQAEWLREFCVGAEIVAVVPIATSQEGRAG